MKMRSILCLFVLLFFHLQIWAAKKIAVRGPLSEPVIEVPLSPQQAAALKQDTQEKAANILTLRMLINNMPADVVVNGRYVVTTENKLAFSPLYKLGHNTGFEVQYTADGETEVLRFITPANPASKTVAEVANIYPLADTIPFNTLFFNIRFSQPMMNNLDAYKYVKVYDETGAERTKAWRQRVFWMDSGRLMVLMIHPGRVKTGIHYAGPLFDSGRHYTVTVGKDIQDVNGNVVAAAGSKKYYVSGVDQLSPKAKIENTPAAGSTTPLLLSFSEGMDYTSVFDGAKVYNEKGVLVSQNISNTNDRQYSITAASPWQKGKYKLVLANAVYDYAANRIRRLFEVADPRELEKDHIETILSFEIR